MKVLYVEDNPANVFLVKRVAKMGKHEIINYIDGDQAILKFDEINPDLVLMDIQLAGGMSGLDVVKKLREKGIQTPIIAVTAYAMVGDKERCIDAGCTDYLAKPLPIPRLVEIFKHYSDEAEAKSASTVNTPTPKIETAEPQTVKTEDSVSTAVSEVEKSTQEDTINLEVNTPEATSDEKLSNTTVKTDPAKDATDEKSSDVITKTEPEDTTLSKVASDVSSNKEVDDTIGEKPVAPINLPNTIENKEEVSKGETL